MNIAAAADAFLVARDTTKAASTVARDYQIMRNLPLDVLAVDVQDLTRADLWTVITGWDGALATRKRVRITLKAFTAWLAATGQTSANIGADLPVPVVGRPPRPPHPIPWRSIPEVLAGVHPHYQGLVRFAAHTGLRWGELRPLRVADVRLDADPPQVIVAKSQPDDCPVKGTKGTQNRIVPLDRVARETAQLAATGKERDSYLFHTPRGEQLRESSFKRDSRFGVAAPGHRFHDLRHTAAVRWLNSPKIDAADIQRWLGHADLTETQRYLSGLTVSTRDAALIAALDAGADYE